jgi:hypothetical protein
LKLLEGVGEKDTALVFLAGMASGRATAITFCQTMPHESRARVKARAHLIDWGHIQGTLTKSAGTHVLFVDSCHSGGAYNTTLSRDARQEHFVAFAATASAGNAQGSPCHRGSCIPSRLFHLRHSRGPKRQGRGRRRAWYWRL